MRFTGVGVIFVVMKLHTIDTGFFKLDGGAMFGVVPKTIWNKLNPADERNLCTWAMRCLLVEDGDRLCLIDTGLGNKQDEKFFSHYEPSGTTLLESLKQNGFSPNDVTDVFLTHLHFDHCGGAVMRTTDGKLQPQFRNAKYYSHVKHWETATKPNAREKASFLKENILPLQESGQLVLLNGDEEIMPGFTFFTVSGHTDSMMLPLIQYKATKVLYMADLVPSAGHLPIPYAMGYDMQPLLVMQEKEKILGESADKNWVLFFEHDPKIEVCTLHRTEKGIRLKEQARVAEL